MGVEGVRMGDVDSGVDRVVYTPSPETATDVVSTYPTGIHYYLHIYANVPSKKLPYANNSNSGVEL